MLIGENTILRRIEQSDLWRLWRWHEERELLLLREMRPYLSWDELNEKYVELFGWQGTFLAEEKDGFAFGIYAYRDVNWKNRCCKLYLQLVDAKRENAFEALRLMTAFLFDELGILRIHAALPGSLAVENEILECSGFACEGKLREAYFSEGDYHDVLTYALLSDGVEDS